MSTFIALLIIVIIIFLLLLQASDAVIIFTLLIAIVYMFAINTNNKDNQDCACNKKNDETTFCPQQAAKEGYLIEDLYRVPTEYKERKVSNQYKGSIDYVDNDKDNDKYNKTSYADERVVYQTVAHDYNERQIRGQSDYIRKMKPLFAEEIAESERDSNWTGGNEY